MTEHSVDLSYSRILVGVSIPVVLGFANGFYIPPLFASNQVAFWLVDILQYWIVPLTILYLLYRNPGLVPRDYGLTAPDRNYPAWEMTGAGIFAAVVLVIVSTVFWFLGFLVFGAQDYTFSFKQVVPEGALHIPVVLYLSITAGVVEEIFYRGLLWTAFSRMNLGRFKELSYVLIGSVLFAAIHWEQGLAGVVSTLAFGIVAAVLYLQLKNLWPMITAHILVDIYYFW